MLAPNCCKCMQIPCKLRVVTCTPLMPRAGMFWMVHDGAMLQGQRSKAPDELLPFRFGGMKRLGLASRAQGGSKLDLTTVGSALPFCCVLEEGEVKKKIIPNLSTPQCHHLGFIGRDAVSRVKTFRNCPGYHWACGFTCYIPSHPAITCRIRA